MRARLGALAADWRSRDRLLWGVAVAAVALSVVMRVVASAVVEPPPRVPGGVVLPRMPGPAPTSVPQLLRGLGVGSIIWYACFASAPLFVWMSRRFRLGRRGWPRSVAVHVAAIVLLALLTAAVQYRINYGGSPLAPPLGIYLQVGLITGVLPFVTVAAAAQALDARARAHERELEAERVRSQLAESRLAALTAQLQPHFLFNTLQGISTLIRSDPAAADDMLGNLSDLLREVLHRGGQREVALREELAVLAPYLDISRRRFGERLTVRVDVSDDAARARVPFFVLQPLVENALHHGVSSHAGPGTVCVAARRAGDTLELSVTDDGPGVVAPDARRGIGLANTRARLHELYGDAHRFACGRRDGGGFRVTIALPYRA